MKMGQHLLKTIKNKSYLLKYSLFSLYFSNGNAFLQIIKSGYYLYFFVLLDPKPVPVNQFRHLREIRIIWILTRLLMIIMHNLRRDIAHIWKIHAHTPRMFYRMYEKSCAFYYFNVTFWLSFFIYETYANRSINNELKTSYKSFERRSRLE